MIPLIYALKNGKPGKTEQMALATLDGLRDEFVPYVFAPESEIIWEARKLGLIAQSFSGAADFTMKLGQLLSANLKLGFVTADSKLSYSAVLLNFFYRRKLTHLHLFGEETPEKFNLLKREKLNKFDVTLVASSRTVREKLIARGVRHERIRVVENFLPEEIKNSSPRRRVFQTNGVRQIVVVSRLEPEKRIELLFEALERKSSLRSLEFSIFGTGSRLEILKKIAAEKYPNVTFEGFGENVPQKLADSDLYLHLCPDEAANLTILGAMAADVPVLVPDIGSEKFITPNVSGFSFEADNADSLAARLEKLSGISFEHLNTVVKGGRYLLDIRFSAAYGVEKYRRLLNENRTVEIDLAQGKLIL